MQLLKQRAWNYLPENAVVGYLYILHSDAHMNYQSTNAYSVYVESSTRVLCICIELL